MPHIAVLEWESKFELRFNDYIAQRIGKTYQFVLIRDTEKSFTDIIGSVIAFEHREQFLALIVYANNPCVLLVLIHKTDVPYSVCFAEFVFAVWHNGIALFIQIAYRDIDLKTFFSCVGNQTPVLLKKL